MFDAGKTARKYVRAKTNIGLARTISDPKALDRYRRASRVKPLEPAEALAIFDRYANLPTLPPDFELIDHDIILITVDALRWDQTSLADPSLRTTPNLVKFAKDGAFDYTRAYSPSSTTLQSMASIMAMSPPMAAHLDIWKRTWAGRLRLSAVTVAELLRGMGYATHWVGHDHRAVFTEQIIGVEQGFHSRSLVPETGRGWTSRGVDAQIAKLGVAKLDEVPIDQPLFAWFFFASPHAPYVVHNRKKPKDSDLDRYRQEVRNADRQIGHILDKLREQDRLDSSIVIITSDHGEEFGERGGERHAKSVYEEVTHVPLLIRIPELPGTKVDVPTSSIYLFPWLLRHGNEAAQEQVTKILCTRIALLMKATQGAVPVQLLGRDHHYSGLILDDTKLIYDHVHEILEVYDLAADPGETDDLSFSDPERVAQLEPLLESFLDVRAYSQNFRLQPRKTLWREQDEAWLDEKIGEQGALVPETAEVEVVKTPKKTKKRKTKKRKSKSRSKNDRVEPAKDAKPEFVQPARPKTAPNLPTAPQPQ
jgi:arylsulfatase A-like enzyme